MSSWFGGPASTTKHRSSSDGAFIRSSGNRSPSPKRYFVRDKSPTGQSTRSFGSMFGGKHSSSSSYYRRRPRDGFVSRIIHKIKRYLSDIIDYARRNPLKCIMLILPLITGGALAGVMKTMGISLPAGLAGFMGGNRGGYGGAGGFGGYGGGGNEGFGVEQALNIAKMFV